jgi:predicted nucleotidyltransferase
MTRRDRQILAELAAALRKRFPEARVWAFGSRTTGHHTEESDLDVCVVVDRLDEPADREIMRTAWRVGFEKDVVISTLTYSREEFEGGPSSESPLVQIILHDGVPA